MEDKLITHFIPANVIEHPSNTFPCAKLEDKVRKAMQRYIVDGEYTGRNIPYDKVPKLLIMKCYFDVDKMGYDVIARKL